MAAGQVWDGSPPSQTRPPAHPKPAPFIKNNSHPRPILKIKRGGADMGNSHTLLALPRLAFFFFFL